jgi:uncharacterized coiled-coil DUF342 family protein
MATAADAYAGLANRVEKVEKALERLTLQTVRELTDVKARNDRLATEARETAERNSDLAEQLRQAKIRIDQLTVQRSRLRQQLEDLRNKLGEVYEDIDTESDMF